MFYVRTAVSLRVLDLYVVSADKLTRFHFRHPMVLHERQCKVSKDTDSLVRVCINNARIDRGKEAQIKARVGVSLVHTAFAFTDHERRTPGVRVVHTKRKESRHPARRSHKLSALLVVQVLVLVVKPIAARSSPAPCVHDKVEVHTVVGIYTNAAGRRGWKWGCRRKTRTRRRRRVGRRKEGRRRRRVCCWGDESDPYVAGVDGVPVGHAEVHF